MLPEQVEPRLRGRFGRPYLWLDECESTQELARPLPEGGVDGGPAFQDAFRAIFETA